MLRADSVARNVLSTNGCASGSHSGCTNLRPARDTSTVFSSSTHASTLASVTRNRARYHLPVS